MNNILKIPNIKTITIIIILISIGIGIYYNNVTVANDNVIEKISIHGNYMVYDSLSDLEDKADLILYVESTTDFLDREHVTKFYKDDAIEDFYTITPIKIKEVLKQPSISTLKQGDEMKVIEPITLASFEENGKMVDMILARENYTELKKGNEYLVFLKENTFGEFAIMSSNLGIYNLYESRKDDVEGHNH